MVLVKVWYLAEWSECHPQHALVAPKLRAQQQRNHHNDFIMCPIFRLTWNARIGWTILHIL